MIRLNFGMKTFFYTGINQVSLCSRCLRAKEGIGQPRQDGIPSYICCIPFSASRMGGSEDSLDFLYSETEIFLNINIP